MKRKQVQNIAVDKNTYKSEGTLFQRYENHCIDKNGPFAPIPKDYQCQCRVFYCLLLTLK